MTCMTFKSSKWGLQLNAPCSFTHTCSELSLRILLWNASYVQKQSNYTWPERTRNGELEADPCLRLQKEKQIATTVQWKLETNDRHAGSWLSRLPYHRKWKKWQSDLASYVHDIHAKICRYRWMISSPFPHHTIASLRQVGMTGMTGLTPLRWKSRKKHQSENRQDDGQKFYIYSNVTHTHMHLHHALPECRLQYSTAQQYLPWIQAWRV